MTLAEKIDKCGLRTLILLLFWLIFGKLGVPVDAMIVATFASAMCVVGAAESLRGKRETVSAPVHRVPLAPRIKEAARAALTRKNARRFALVALTLLVFSLFVTVPVWYYIMIGLNIALVCLCFAASGH